MTRIQDEQSGLPERAQRELAYEGMLFVTTYKVGGADYGGVLVARLSAALSHSCRGLSH